MKFSWAFNALLHRTQIGFVELTSGSIFQHLRHFDPEANLKSTVIPLTSSEENADFGALSRESVIDEVMQMSANGMLFSISKVF